jgi:hypothetical protein
MKTQGARIAEFEKSDEQVAYEQALQSWNAAIMEMAKAGVPAQSFPPQPTPQQFNYVPGQSGASVQQPMQEATKVNNITNNITNQEAV